MAIDDTESMRRCVLYYPTIDVPAGGWLRQAVMYWDEIGSIVPQAYDDVTPRGQRYSSDIQMLKAEGVFRPFNPEALKRLRNGGSIIKEFETELRTLLDGEEFKGMLGSGESLTLSERIYRDKVNHEVFEILEDKGLAMARDQDHRFYYFEQNAALLYMAMLAKYLADNDKHATVPGTDLRAYEDLSFKAARGRDGMPCIETRLNILPVPRDDADLGKILRYRRSRKDNLNNFRRVLDDMHADLKKCESTADAKQVLVKYKEQIEGGVDDIRSTLDDQKIPTVTGTLKAIFKPDVVKGALLIAAVSVGPIFGLPAKLALAPLVVAVVPAAIEVADFLANRGNAKRSKLRDSCYSYLALAEQEQII